VRIRSRVIVEEREIGALGGPDAEIVASRESEVARALDEAEPALALTTQVLERAIRGTVLDDNDLEGRIGLRGERMAGLKRAALRAASAALTGLFSVDLLFAGWFRGVEVVAVFRKPGTPDTAR